MKLTMHKDYVDPAGFRHALGCTIHAEGDTIAAYRGAGEWQAVRYAANRPVELVAHGATRAQLGRSLEAHIARLGRTGAPALAAQRERVAASARRLGA